MLLFVQLSISSFAQDPVYWLIQDGSLNPSYALAPDTTTGSSQLLFDETAPDGSNACKFVRNQFDYTAFYFDLKNDPVDLDKARYLCIEYMYTEDFVSKLHETDFSSQPIFEFMFGTDMSSVRSYDRVCFSGIPSAKANVYQTLYQFIYLNPNDKVVEGLFFEVLSHFTDFVGSEIFIKNLSVCSIETTPFYAEDFQTDVYWNTLNYTNSKNIVDFHGGYPVTAEGSNRISFCRGYEFSFLHIDDDTVPYFLDDEILHALVVDQPIHIYDIDIPEGTKFIASNAILKDVANVNLSYSFVLDQTLDFSNVSDKSFTANVVFDDSTVVPLFGSDVLSSDWNSHVNVILVPSGAKKLSLEFNYNSIPYFIDNLWLTSFLDYDGPISVVDTIPTDTIPTDIVPTDTIPTDTIPTDIVPTDTIPTDTIPTDYSFVEDTVSYSFVLDGISFASYLYPDGTSYIYEVVGGEIISVPESIEYEGSYYSVTSLSVQGNDTITKLIVPASVAYLHLKSIVDCPNLSEVVLSSDLCQLSAYAFNNCESLRKIVYSGSLMEWSSSSRFYWWNVIDSINSSGFTAEPIDIFVEDIPLINTESLVLPDGLEFIGDYAFYGCKKLESVVFPTSLRFIGEAAFLSSENLKSLTFPCALDSIGQQAFLHATNLDSVVCLGFPPSVDLVEESYLETFGTYNVPLYVTNIYGFIYKKDDFWSKFDTIIYINATDIELDETSNPVEIVLDDVSATVSWKEVEGATAYVLTIFQDGDTLVVLEFDENGVLEYMLDANSILRSMIPGFSYTLYGLDDPSRYSYDFVVKGMNEAELVRFDGSFPSPVSEEVVVPDECSVITPYVWSENGSIVVACESDVEVKVFNSLGYCLYQGLGSITFKAPNLGFYVVTCGEKSYRVIVKN